MKTQADALAWLNSQIGQHLDYDHLYGDQCVDFFNFYYQFVTGDGPFLDGYQVKGAKSLFGVTNSRLDRIPDSNTLVPQPGDIAVYGSTWGAGDGHVEVCLQSDAHGSFFVGENEHGNTSEGVVKVYRTWAQMRGLEGVLRFHFAAPAPAPAPQPPVAAPAGHPNDTMISRTGTATVTNGPIHVRTEPSTDAAVVADYAVGQSFNYDSYIKTNGYVWLSYISNGGARHYVAEGPNDGVETNVWVSGGV